MSRIGMQLSDHQSVILRGIALGLTKWDFSNLPDYKGHHPLILPYGLDGVDLIDLRIQRPVGYRGVMLYHGTTSKAYIGRPSQLPNYASRIAIQAITSRTQTTVLTDDPHAGAAEACYLLVDPDVTCVNADAVAGGFSYLPHQELVWATIAAGGVNGTVTFTRVKTDVYDGVAGLSATYGANSYLVPISVSTNINFIGGHCMGKDAAGVYGASSAALSNMQLVGVDGLTFSGGFLHEGHEYDGIAGILVRNIEVDDCDFGDSNAGTTAGKGYPMALYGYANLLVNNSRFYDGLRNFIYGSYGAMSKVIQFCRGTDLQNDYPVLNAGHGIGFAYNQGIWDNEFAGDSIGGIGAGSTVHGCGDINVSILRNKLNGGGDIQIHMSCENVLIQGNDGSDYEAPNSQAIGGAIILVGATDRTMGSGAIVGGVPAGPVGPKDISAIGNRMERIYTSGSFLPGGATRWQGFCHILGNHFDNAAVTSGRPIEMQNLYADSSLKIGGNTIIHRGSFSAVLINGNGVSVTAEYGEMTVDGEDYGPNAVQHTDGGNSSDGITLSGTGVISGDGENSMTGGSGTLVTVGGSWSGEVEEDL